MRYLLPLLIFAGPIAIVGIAFVIFPPLGIVLAVIAILIAFGLNSGPE